MRSWFSKKNDKNAKNDNKIKTIVADTGAAKSKKSNTVPFYYKLERLLSEKLGGNTPVDQIISILNSPRAGVSQDEIFWSGVLDWLKSFQPGTKLSKDQVLAHVRSSSPVINSKHLQSMEDVNDFPLMRWQVYSSGITKINEFDIRERILSEHGKDILKKMWESDYFHNKASEEFADEQEGAEYIERIQEALFGQYQQDTLADLLSSEQYEILNIAEELPDSESVNSEDEYENGLTIRDQVRNSLILERGGRIEEKTYGAYGIPKELDYLGRIVLNVYGPNGEFISDDITIDELDNDDSNRCIDLRLQLGTSIGHPDIPYSKQYAEYALEGGEDYRETIITWENGGRMKSPHFDQDNILAHYRSTKRVGPDGDSVLLLEELQSDWHEKGREHGYSHPDKDPKNLIKTELGSTYISDYNALINAYVSKVRSMFESHSVSFDAVKNIAGNVTFNVFSTPVHSDQSIDLAFTPVINFLAQNPYKPFVLPDDQISSLFNSVKKYLEQKINGRPTDSSKGYYADDWERISGDEFRTALKAINMTALLSSGWTEFYTRYSSLLSEYSEMNSKWTSSVAPAPFSSTEDWVSLLLKKAVEHAVIEGYSAVAVVPGWVQNERYDFSDKVDALRIIYDNLEIDKAQTVEIKTFKDGNAGISKTVGNNFKEIDAVIGFELRNRLMSSEVKTIVLADGSPYRPYRELAGQIRLDSSGMESFYDRMVPSIAKKLGKKFNSGVKTIPVNIGKKQNIEQVLTIVDMTTSARKAIYPELASKYIVVEKDRTDLDGEFKFEYPVSASEGYDVKKYWQVLEFDYIRKDLKDKYPDYLIHSLNSLYPKVEGDTIFFHSLGIIAQKILGVYNSYKEAYAGLKTLAVSYSLKNELTAETGTSGKVGFIHCIGLQITDEMRSSIMSSGFSYFGSRSSSIQKKSWYSGSAGGSEDQTISYPTKVKKNLGSCAVDSNGHIGVILAQSVDREPKVPYYSKLIKLIETKVSDNTGVQQVLGVIRSPRAEISKDELFWSGLEEWLESMEPGKKLTKAEVLKQIEANSPKTDTYDVLDYDLSNLPHMEWGSEVSIPRKDIEERVISSYGLFILEKMYNRGDFKQIASDYYPNADTDEEESIEQSEYYSLVKSAIEDGNNPAFLEKIYKDERNLILDHSKQMDINWNFVDEDDTESDPSMYEAVRNEMILESGLAIEEIEYGAFAIPVEMNSQERVLYNIQDKDGKIISGPFRYDQFYSKIDHVYDELREILAKEIGNDNIPYSDDFKDYTLPGGTTYRETLVSWTNTDNEHNGHFEDKKVLAHYRSKIRKDENDNSVLFIEELQSDWHEKGRSKGYQTKENDPERVLESPEFANIVPDYKEMSSKFIQILYSKAAQNGIPPNSLRNSYTNPDMFPEADNLNKVMSIMISFIEHYSYMMDIVADPAEERQIFAELASVLSKEVRRKNFNVFTERTVRNKMGYVFKLCMDEAGFESFSSKYIPLINEYREKKRQYPHLTENAPYSSTEDWVGLLLKKAVERAVVEGHSAVAWTPGWVQNDRYDFSSLVDKISLAYYGDPENKGTRVMVSTFKNGSQTMSKYSKNDKESIQAIIGFELYTRLMGQPLRSIDDSVFVRELSGEIKLDSSGMIKFYDEIVPITAKKLFKKFDGKLSPIRIPMGSNSETLRAGIRVLYIGNSDFMYSYPHLRNKWAVIASSAGDNWESIEIPDHIKVENFKFEGGPHSEFINSCFDYIKRFAAARHPDHLLMNIDFEYDEKTGLLDTTEILGFRGYKLYGVFDNEVQANAERTKIQDNTLRSKTILDTESFGSDSDTYGILPCYGIQITEEMKASVLSKGFSHFGSRLSKNIKKSWYSGAGRSSGDRVNRGLNIVVSQSSAKKESVPYYSKLEKLIDSKVPENTNAQQVLGIIRSPRAEVSRDEVFWSGLENWLSSLPENAKIKKFEVLRQINDNSPKLNTYDLRDYSTHSLPRMAWEQEEALRSGIDEQEIENEVIYQYGFNILNFLLRDGEFHTIAEERFGSGTPEEAEYIKNIQNALLFRDRSELSLIYGEFWQKIIEISHEFTWKFSDVSEDQNVSMYDQSVNKIIIGNGVPLKESTYGVQAIPKRFTEDGHISYDIIDPKTKQTISSKVMYADFGDTYEDDVLVAVAKAVGHEKIPYVDTYDKYTVPGGQDYRETLVSWTNSGNPFPSHFESSDNKVLAHYRSKIRKDVDGNSVLFIEELQSDWHEQGRKRGYQTPESNPDVDLKSDKFSNIVPEYNDFASRYKSSIESKMNSVNISKEDLDRHGIDFYELWSPENNVKNIVDKLELYVGNPFVKVPVASGMEKKIRSDREMRGLNGLKDICSGPQIPTREYLRQNERRQFVSDITKVAMIESGWQEFYDKYMPLVEEYYAKKKDYADAPHPAPYSSTEDWVGLLLKKAVERAVVDGHSSVAWTPGWIQNDRYDFSSQIDRLRLHWDKNDPQESKTVFIFGYKNRKTVIEKSVANKIDAIDEVIGSELRQRIMAAPIIIHPVPDNERGKDLGSYREISGEIKLDSHGMESFYDKIVPMTAKKLFKKFDARPIPIEIPIGEKSSRLSSNIDILLVENSDFIYAYPELKSKYVMIDATSGSKSIFPESPIQLSKKEFDLEYSYSDYKKFTSEKFRYIREKGKFLYPNFLIKDIQFEYSDDFGAADFEQVQSLDAYPLLGVFDSREEANAHLSSIKENLLRSKKLDPSSSMRREDFGLLQCFCIPITDEIRSSVLSKGFSTFGSKANWFTPLREKEMIKTARKIRLYHSTEADFDDFDYDYDTMGYHFGTREQAINRLEDVAGGHGWLWIIEANIKNPLDLRDAGDIIFWSADAVARSMIKHGEMSDADWDSFNASENRQIWMRDYILGQGYDAIIYENEVESEYGDSESYILLHPDFKVVNKVQIGYPELTDRYSEDYNSEFGNGSITSDPVQSSSVRSFLKTADYNSLKSVVDSIILSAHGLEGKERMKFLVKKLKSALASEFGWVVDEFSPSPESDIQYILDNYESMQNDREQSGYNPNKKRFIVSPYLADSGAKMNSDPLTLEMSAWIEARLIPHRPIHKEWAVRQCLLIYDAQMDLKSQEDKFYAIVSDLNTYLKNSHLFPNVNFTGYNAKSLAYDVKSLKPNFDSFDWGSQRNTDFDADLIPDLWDEAASDVISRMSDDDIIRSLIDYNANDPDYHEELGTNDDYDDKVIARVRKHPTEYNEAFVYAFQYEYNKRVRALMFSDKDPVKVEQMVSGGDVYALYHCNSVEDCKKLGSGTSWCFRAEEEKDYEISLNYLREGDLWVIYRNNKPHRALDLYSSQFMDKNDDPIGFEELETGIFSPWFANIRRTSYQNGIEKNIIKKGNGRSVLKKLVVKGEEEYETEIKSIIMNRDISSAKSLIENGILDENDPMFPEIVGTIFGIKDMAKRTGYIMYFDNSLKEILNPLVAKGYPWALDILKVLVSGMSVEEVNRKLWTGLIDGKNFPSEYQRAMNADIKFTFEDMSAISYGLKNGRISIHNPKVLDAAISVVLDPDNSGAFKASIAAEILGKQDFPSSHPQFIPLLSFVLENNSSVFFWIQKSRGNIFTQEIINKAIEGKSIGLGDRAIGKTGLLYSDALTVLKQYTDTEDGHLNPNAISMFVNLVTSGILGDHSYSELFHKIIEKAVSVQDSIIVRSILDRYCMTRIDMEEQTLVSMISMMNGTEFGVYFATSYFKEFLQKTDDIPAIILEFFISNMNEPASSESIFTIVSMIMEQKNIKKVNLDVMKELYDISMDRGIKETLKNLFDEKGFSFGQQSLSQQSSSWYRGLSTKKNSWIKV